jgi:dihydrofolate synthase/folylpolyglutamate synthase
MTYEEVVQEILEQGKFGSASGFEDIQSWMKILGPVDEGLQVIHIAGTNGKGSTSMMVASILATMGFRVGLFTSPHLKRFTERIRIVQRRESVHAESEIITLEIPKADLA